MKRLVVIDDEFIVVEGIRAIIKKTDLDYDVVGFAYDGIEAARVILEEKPDVVITDIRIPGMDGLSLIESMKAELPDTLFIVISGYQEFEYARKALSLGVKGYIDKPITVEKLRDALIGLEDEMEKQLIQKDSELNMTIEKLMDDMIHAVRTRQDREVLNLLSQIKEELLQKDSTTDFYKAEMNKVLCVSIGSFFEERAAYEHERHFPSYKNMELLNSIEEIDDYVDTIMHRMTDKMKISKTGSSHQTIHKVLAYINENYARDIGLNEIADLVHMNPAYLSILFKDEVGTSYIKYLTKIRIDKAKELLLEGGKVTRISEQVGYRNYRYFCDIFKKQEGMTPNEYRGRKGPVRASGPIGG